MGQRATWNLGSVVKVKAWSKETAHASEGSTVDHFPESMDQWWHHTRGSAGFYVDMAEYVCFYNYEL